jgi:uridine kinase
MNNIKLSGNALQIPLKSKVRDLIDYVPESDKRFQICGALVNNTIKSLEYELENEDNVTLFDITTEIGYRIYESTLLLVLECAVSILYPERSLMTSYSLGGGIFCKFRDEPKMDPETVEKIKGKMQELIESDLVIHKIKMPLEEAKAFARQKKFITSTELLEFCEFDRITFYELMGYYGYYHAKTLSKTGDIKDFDLIVYEPGFVLIGVERRSPERLKTLVHQDNIHTELQSYEKWLSRLGVSDVTSLNRIISQNPEAIANLITIAEARHEQLITKIAGEIFDQRDQKRVVLISGPSCSGKTTTSKRLRNHLVALGLNPVAISLDDYFINRDKTPLDEFGQLDYESIKAIDVELFNDQLIALMEGETVEIPKYSFRDGRREECGTMLHVDSSSPIIIEGIHGLNESLTPHLPKETKYKIYINDLTHLNLDQSNRIPTSDVRLLRRIVRDSVARGHNALATIAMWQSVKRGEEKYIYPYSSEADFVFNSSLFYEMSIIKKYAVPSLKEIDEGSVYYYEALRLLEFLSFFRTIEDERAIYTNSILREFIGGNVFDFL